MEVRKNVYEESRLVEIFLTNEKKKSTEKKEINYIWCWAINR